MSARSSCHPFGCSSELTRTRYASNLIKEPCPVGRHSVRSGQVYYAISIGLSSDIFRFASASQTLSGERLGERRPLFREALRSILVKDRGERLACRVMTPRGVRHACRSGRTSNIRRAGWAMQQPCRASHSFRRMRQSPRRTGRPEAAGSSVTVAAWGGFGCLVAIE